MRSGAEIWDPLVDPETIEQLAQRWVAAGLAVETDVSLAPLTTFGIGGPAAVMVTVETREELVTMMAAYEPDDVVKAPLLVLGKGSNLLVSDSGFAGAVVKLGKGFKHMRRDGVQVSAGGGEAMPALAAWCAKVGLAGLEFAAGIPATVGGSVRMNAGAHGSSTGVPLLHAELIAPGEQDLRTVPAGELGFSYRHSTIAAGTVVASATWLLVEDDPAAVRARLDEVRTWRRETQPIGERNCGSVFTNPEGDSAGRLIDAAGLKGLRVGGAEISRKHANFITVSADASAQDVLALIAKVREVVEGSGGPLLTPEVRVVGTF